jgi:O-antigen/teichoic acid export membrane protein
VPRFARRLVSVEAVAWYTVAMELAQRLLMIQSNVAQAYYPAACAAASDQPGFARLYLRSARAVAMLTFPLALLLVVLAKPLLGWWVGPQFEAAAPLLQIVVLAYAIMALTAIPAAAADALNQPGISVRYGLVSVVLNLAFALLLIPRFGGLGAALAIALVVLVQTPPFLYRVTRLAWASAGDVVRKVVLEPLVPAILLALPVLAAWQVLPDSRARLPLTLAIAAVTSVVVSRAAVRLDPDERAFIAAMPGGSLIGRIMGRA